jgi:DNA-3-methyladenine glycosylase I
VAGQAPPPVRCPWPGDDPLYQRYHDFEWGVPLADDQALFELLLLEGFQAGLSWLTILKRREGMRLAFDGFDPARLAAYGEADLARLLGDPRIVRNRLKAEAAVKNARAYLALRDAGRRFSDHLWDFVDGRPVQNAWRAMADVPAATPLSERLSRDLKSRGFTFVGATIAYAFLQAAGFVNDHLVSCFRWRELGGGA